MYVWCDTDKLYEGVRIIFTDTEKSNWTWDEVAQQYYWHRFFSHQPDLNFDNPRVMEEVLNAMRFWLDMGVDALRLDAIPYLVERDGTTAKTSPRPTSRSRKSAPPSTPSTTTASSSPKPTCGPPTSAPTSATATSATWPSTSR